ncbi:MAG TPA: hypothetical protein VFM46_08295, partial [Pseudomonadales bacterium]|nr:hypothetical protein [Pseudomonadales bacterium]
TAGLIDAIRHFMHVEFRHHIKRRHCRSLQNIESNTFSIRFDAILIKLPEQAKPYPSHCFALRPWRPILNEPWLRMMP